MKINECSPFDSRASGTCPVLFYMLVLSKHAVTQQTVLLCARRLGSFSAVCPVLGPLSARSLLFPLFRPGCGCRCFRNCVAHWM